MAAGPGLHCTPPLNCTAARVSRTPPISLMRKPRFPKCEPPARGAQHCSGPSVLQHQTTLSLPSARLAEGCLPPSPLGVLARFPKCIWETEQGAPGRGGSVLRSCSSCLGPPGSVTSRTGTACQNDTGLNHWPLWFLQFLIPSNSSLLPGPLQRRRRNSCLSPGCALSFSPAAPVQVWWRCPLLPHLLPPGAPTHKAIFNKTNRSH